tara:strand:+ start:1174 stop:1314 length:141 start_codon:yes stop_codon:yes gene_type:complete
MISLVKKATTKFQQWILGKGKAFTDQIVAPPYAILVSSTSTAGGTQ